MKKKTIIKKLKELHDEISVIDIQPDNKIKKSIAYEQDQILIKVYDVLDDIILSYYFEKENK